MGRRTKASSALTASAVVVLCAVGFCCGGPIAFVKSLSSPQKTEIKHRAAVKAAAVPSTTAEATFQFRPTTDYSDKAVIKSALPPAPVAVIPDVDVPLSAEPAQVAPQQLPDIFRKWTDDTGQFSVIAVAARWDSNEAKLQREDGKLLTLPLGKLSAADQAYLHTVKFPPTYLPGGKVALGKAVGVTDGDTIKLIDEEKGNYTIRLEGIDAPESHQAFGTQAKKTLSEKVFGKVVRVEWKETDKYGRTLGHVYFGNRHINLELVNEGMAWHYKKYSTDQNLAAAENLARDQAIGLWRDSRPIAPWDFRSGKSDAAASIPALPMPSMVPLQAPFTEMTVTVYVTTTGEKYHRGGCRHLSKSRIPISLSRAQASYSPCSVCNPP
ncbi:Thermonuclease precursor [Anatilimnocola aggregata]|uniref:Thermonuclease n=1 Tax=Anatilimnocola aggregata TaxID=2528021 RepID=A0A517YF48_9BACT|nr:thermonuclease family protein [Anatilimnocola aggregata]QDU28858.1 Thermonuclease precursor [Anatilimnocola aggregata]